MTRTKLLNILQEETDGFKEQSRLRDDVLDAMEQAYIKGKKEQLTIPVVIVSDFCSCDGVQDLHAMTGECRKCGKECDY